MCILLELYYANFGVSSLFFQKLSKKNLWGDRLDPLVKGRVKYEKHVIREIKLYCNGRAFKEFKYCIDSWEEGCGV